MVYDKNTPILQGCAKHLYQIIQTSRYMNDDLNKIVDPVIERNSFFAHPENIIIAMITDERRHMYVRELGLRRILKARHNSKGAPTRQFKVRRLNFDCTDYTDVIDWSADNMSEPPINRKVTEACQPHLSFSWTDSLATHRRWKDAQNW